MSKRRTAREKHEPGIKAAGKNDSFADIINKSINQTLSRTLITSLTTFVVVVSIFTAFMGSGNVLETFTGALIVGIISGIILALWKTLIQIIVVIHWIVVIFSGKRQKGFAEFCEIWNTQIYVFLRYMTFVSNKRPFPFNKLEPNLSKFGK